MSAAENQEFPRFVQRTIRGTYWEIAPGLFNVTAPLSNADDARTLTSGYFDLQALKRLKGDV